MVRTGIATVEIWFFENGSDVICLERLNTTRWYWIQRALFIWKRTDETENLVQTDRGETDQRRAIVGCWRWQSPTSSRRSSNAVEFGGGNCNNCSAFGEELVTTRPLDMTALMEDHSSRPEPSSLSVLSLQKFTHLRWVSFLYTDIFYDILVRAVLTYS